MLMDLFDRLKWLRKHARPHPLTQVQLGDLIGKGQTYVSEVERGKRLRVSPDEAAEWAEACGYYGVMVFLTDDQLSDDGPSLLADADPETINMVLDLLRSLPEMSQETRQTVHTILRSLIGAGSTA